mgnify:CR=1 FL=1
MSKPIEIFADNLSSEQAQSLFGQFAGIPERDFINRMQASSSLFEQVEAASVWQLMDSLNQEFAIRAAGMPDMHRGYAMPIGGVVATEDVVVPAWVGYDIGCGMCAVPTTFSAQEIRAQQDAVFEAIYRHVPTGKKGHAQPVVDPERVLGSLPSRQLQEIYAQRGGAHACGTLGGGNHFIELGEAETDGRIWIVLHSGSRGPGHGTAQHFMALASGDGRPREGHHGLRADSPEGRAYISALDWLLRFALLNRETMLQQVERALNAVGLRGELIFDQMINRNHNHAEQREDGLWVHRKGATHAEHGMAGVIPGDMEHGSYIVSGLGHEQALRSSSHGAGRRLSRKQAKNMVNLEAFQERMKQAGIRARVSEATLDEAPDAYKGIKAIIAQQVERGLIEVVEHVQPIVNIKE